MVTAKVPLLKNTFLLSLLFLAFAIAVSPSSPALASDAATVLDYTDPTYGGAVRQLHKPDGNEHNLYHYRDVWNADNTYMVGINARVDDTDWRVVLYDGNGIFIKQLFSISQYDWRLVWDRHDPKILYTWKGSNLYRYDVEAGVAYLLKSFSPLTINPNGPSLNQAGDRILVITSDKVFHSYHLPDMREERSFSVTLPPGYSAGWDKQRYIGYLNYIVTGYTSSDGTVSTTLIYDDSGNLFHQFDSLNYGHSDFSPDGQWAYPRMPTGGRGLPWTPLEVRVVNIDGTNDRAVYSVPREQAAYVQSFHITWPDAVKEWFVVGFFPSPYNLPATYQPPLDEIAIIGTHGTCEYLARTGTSGTPFWSQPLPSPSADGTRISFNGDCSNAVPELGCTDSGTLDQYILYTGRNPPVIPAPTADFTGTPTSGAAPLTVSFTDTSSNAPTSWAWDFDNDGLTDSSEQNPACLYTSPGSHTVRLTAANEGGSDDEVKVNYITVLAVPPPVADFSASPTSGLAPLAVNFADQSTNDPASWAWDFDDDGVVDSTLQNPSHEYSSPGAYTVRLVVSNAVGSDDEVKADYIMVGGKVLFTSVAADDGWVLESRESSNVGGTTNSSGSGPDALRVGDSTGDKQYEIIVSFDTSAIPDGATITGATLKFMRGTVVGTNPFTTHGTCYADIRAGAFGARALERGDFQALATATRVAQMSNPPFEGAISSGALNSAGLEAINRAGITQMRLYFGLDDNDDNGSDFVGFYSGENSRSSRRPVLQVTYVPDSIAPPVADFSASPTSGIAPLTVNFTDLSTNNPTSWTWDFDNSGSTDSTAQNPTHQYVTQGTYSVKLGASNAAGADEEVKGDYISVTSAAAYYVAKDGDDANPGTEDRPWPTMQKAADTPGGEVQKCRCLSA